MKALSTFIMAIVLVADCSVADAQRSSARVAALRNVIRQLQPLHTPLEEPQPGDWLAKHDESGQTFAEYVRSRPVTPQGRRKVIYVQPLGELGRRQREIVGLSAEFLALYFNRPTKIREVLPMSVVPDSARRVHPEWGTPQVLTTYVLDDVLRPRLPRDAAAYIAFTASDLWPGEDWNFVFGQASFRNRVGVWSIHRNGDPELGEEEFQLCLRRTLQIAGHETGHMFSIKHCIAYECNMCGSNSRGESDRRPLYLCPECVAKVCWATRSNPTERFERLADFCDKHGMHGERDFYRRSIVALDE